MLTIAFITLAVLLVLFGICAFATVMNMKDDYDDEPEEEVEKPKKRAEEKPKRRRGDELGEPEDEKGPAEEKPVDEPAAPPEAEGKPAEAPAATEEKEEAKPAEPAEESPSEKTRRIELPNEALSAASDEEKAATRIVTKEEMAQIKAAVAAEDMDGAVRIEDEPDNDDYDDYDDEDYDGPSFNAVPLIIGAAVLLAVLAAVAIFLVRSDIIGRRGEVEAPKTITATVDNIVQKTEFVGTVESASPDVRYFAASGKVETVDVNVGDRVQKGQTLYTLDGSSVEERMDLLRERLNAATVTEQKTVEKSDEIEAPVSGTLTSLTVSSGDEVRAGEAVAEISTGYDSRVIIEFGADAKGIAAGSTVRVNAGETVNGTVVSVTEIGDDDDGDFEATSYRATISFRTSAKPASSATASYNGATGGAGPVSIIEGGSETVRAPVSGKINSLRVSEGDSVSEGEALAKISFTATETQTKTDELVAQDIRLQMEQLENELAGYTVKADVSGYVQKLYLKQGETATVNMQAAVIIPDGSLYISVPMDKDNAAITLPAAAEYKFVRTAESDVPEAVWENVSTDVEYTGVMDVIDPDAVETDKFVGHIAIENQTGLAAGMGASVEVVTYSHYDAVLVPEEFVKDGKVAVWRSNRIAKVKVETGIVTDDGYVEIKSGLNSVDRLVIPGGEAGE